MWRSYAGGHQQWLLLDHGRILLTVFRQAKWVENFWGRTPISPAMRFWAFHARSVPSAVKRNTSCPDNFEHVRMILSSSQSKASCKKSLASLSQTFTNVVPSSLCTGNLALSVPVIYLRKQQRGHRFAEALCDLHLQKLGCMTFLHPMVEYCTDHCHCIRRPQRFHHSGEAHYDSCLQKPGCMRETFEWTTPKRAAHVNRH